MSGRSIFVELDASGDISIARKSFQAVGTCNCLEFKPRNPQRLVAVEQKESETYAILVFLLRPLLLLDNDSNNLEGNLHSQRKRVLLLFKREKDKKLNINCLAKRTMVISCSTI